MQEIKDALVMIRKEGVRHPNRTGVDRIQVSTLDLKFDLREGTPMLTARKQKWQNPFHEINWFLSGSTNIKYLVDNGCPFWNEWALEEDQIEEVPMTIYERMQTYAAANTAVGHLKPSELMDKLHAEGQYELEEWLNEQGVPVKTKKIVRQKGDIGPMYGYLMRKYPMPGGAFDQLAYVLHTLKNNPGSSRILINFWCPHLLPDESISPQENVKRGAGALAPCHFAILFIPVPMSIDERIAHAQANGHNDAVFAFQDEHPYTDTDDWTNFLNELGTPKHWLDLKFHMRSNDVPLGLPANILGYAIMNMMIAKTVNMAERYVIYTGGNVHIYENQLDAVEEWINRPSSTKKPKLRIVGNPKDLFSFTEDDFELVDYESGPHIKIPVAV